VVGCTTRKLRRSEDYLELADKFHIVDEKGFRRYVEVLKVSPVKVEELL